MSAKVMSPSSGGRSPPKARADVYGIVTERIIALMESGKLDWRKTWKLRTGAPRNYQSGRPYRGINLILLAFSGFASPWWLTYRQIQELGGTLRKGEKSSIVTFFKPRYEEREDPETGEKYQHKTGILFRYYHVFNLDQVDGIPDKEAPKDHEKIPGPQELLDGLRPFINAVAHGNPAYRPKDDILVMPAMGEFSDAPEYYATYYHEAIHWTGHPSRIGRKGVQEVLEGKARFGDDVYSQEELVAELGAAFLAGLTGIGDRVEKNNAAYLQHWIKVLKEDTQLIIRAASQAQVAVDYLLAMVEPPEN